MDKNHPALADIWKAVHAIEDRLERLGPLEARVAQLEHEFKMDGELITKLRTDLELVDSKWDRVCSGLDTAIAHIDKRLGDLDGKVTVTTTYEPSDVKAEAAAAAAPKPARKSKHKED
jgi:hypothetical protein